MISLTTNTFTIDIFSRHLLNPKDLYKSSFSILHSELTPRFRGLFYFFLFFFIFFQIPLYCILRESDINVLKDKRLEISVKLVCSSVDIFPFFENDT